MNNNIIDNYIDKIDCIENGVINKYTIMNIENYNQEKQKNKKIKKIHNEAKRYKQNKYNIENDIVYFEPIITETYIKNREKMIKEGNKIYKENDYLAKIWDIMSDKSFSEFFDSYLTNYNDLQVAMVFFHVYKNIKTVYQKTFNEEITKPEMVYMLKQIMRNNFMRKYFIQDAKNNKKIKLNSDILYNDVYLLMNKHKQYLIDK